MRKRNLLCLIFIAAVFMVGCGDIKSDPNTITVWHWMADRHEVFVQLAEQYKQKTGMKVHFQLFAPSDIYSQKIIAAAQAKILPDVFGILDKRSVFGEFIKNGFVADLTMHFEKNDGEWKERFFEKALDANIFHPGNSDHVDPGIYGVPLDVTTIQMVYNKKILEQAGVMQPPLDFDTFLSAAQKISGMGFTPLVSGWSELWLVDYFALNYALNIMGEEKIMRTYRGEVPYTDADWIQVFHVFETLARQGVIEPGIITKSNKFAEQDFALGRAAFAFNGSWCVNVYRGMNPDLDYGVMRVPAISKKYPMKILGGAGSSFMVNPMSPKKEETIAFLKWLTEEEQQRVLSEATQNLPVNRYAMASLPAELMDFGKAMDEMTHPTLWEEEEDALVKERFARGLQSILIGEKTPEQVAHDVQAVKERQLNRARRR